MKVSLEAKQIINPDYPVNKMDKRLNKKDQREKICVENRRRRPVCLDNHKRREKISETILEIFPHCQNRHIHWLKR